VISMTLTRDCFKQQSEALLDYRTLAGRAIRRRGTATQLFQGIFFERGSTILARRAHEFNIKLHDKLP